MKRNGNREQRPIPEMTEKDRTRFWSKVSQAGDDECWLWIAGKFSSGYGCFKLGNQAFYATRIAYFLREGKDPGDLFVCHECDTPACCNPTHLFLGTQQQNVDDRDSKGRGVIKRGDDHWNVKVPDEVVATIQSLDVDPNKYGVKTSLARQYGVTRQTIANILSGKRQVKRDC